MIDATCCFAGSSELLSERSKHMIINEFETAMDDGYKRCLIALKSVKDAEIAEILLETRDNFGNKGLRIEAVAERDIFLTDGDGSNNDYIRNCILRCDGIIIYCEKDCRGKKFYNINHYLLHSSTRVVLLYDSADEIAGGNESKSEKEIDDFFIAHMLRKDVIKLMV